MELHINNNNNNLFNNKKFTFFSILFLKTNNQGISTYKKLF